MYSHGRRARKRALEEAGVADRTDWWQVDARTFAAEGRSYDLVTTHFLHPPDGGMAEVTSRLAEAVATAGTSWSWATRRPRCSPS
jgi:hypothetical protein